MTLAGDAEEDDGTGSESDEEGSPQGGAAGPTGRSRPRPAPAGQAMSGAHRTGVAKLPNVLRWLVNALGGSADDAPAADAATSLGSRADTLSYPDVRMTAEPGPKFIVFAHHRTVMARLAAALDDGGGEGGGVRRWTGVPFVQIDGSTDAVDRRSACARFRDDPAVSSQGSQLSMSLPADTVRSSNDKRQVSWTIFFIGVTGAQAMSLCVTTTVTFRLSRSCNT